MNFDLTIAKLRDDGYRMTPVRRAIVRMFSKIDTPYSIRDTEKYLKKNESLHVNTSTVYREIRFLEKNGYVVTVSIVPTEKSWEASDLLHHHHLICTRCGKVENITQCLTRNLEKDAYKKRGFTVTRHELEFFGLCRTCGVSL